MVPRAKRHFRRNNDFVRILFLDFVKLRTDKTRVLYNYRIHIFFPLFIPILFVNFIFEENQRLHMLIFFLDQFQLTCLSFFLLRICFKALLCLEKCIEASLCNFSHKDFSEVGVTDDLKSGVVQEVLC